MEHDRLGRSFFIITNKMRRFLDKEHQTLNLTHGQARIIRFIYDKSDNHEIFQKELEMFFSIRGSSANGLIQGLIKLGYVKSAILKVDRRKKKLILTKEGEAVAIKSMAIMNAFEQSFNYAITTEEMAFLSSILEKLNHTLDLKEQADV